MGDDVKIYKDESRSQVLQTFHFLRQQRKHSEGKNMLSLADYVAPLESGRLDYMGGFVVTSGHEVEEYAAHFEKNHDDYTGIMIKAIGDRFAEALAELMHKKVREIWGFD